jgi:hypothetical protein
MDARFYFEENPGPFTDIDRLSREAIFYPLNTDGVFFNVTPFQNNNAKQQTVISAPNLKYSEVTFRQSNTPHTHYPNVDYHHHASYSQLLSHLHASKKDLLPTPVKVADPTTYKGYSATMGIRMNGLLALFGTYRANKNCRVTVNAIGHPLSKKNTDAQVITKINYDTSDTAIQVVSNTTSNVFAVSGMRTLKKNIAYGFETKYFAKEETFETSVGASYKHQGTPLEASLKISSLGLVLSTVAVRPLANLLVGARVKTDVRKIGVTNASLGVKYRTNVKDYPVLVHTFARFKPRGRDEEKFEAGGFVGTRVWQDIGVGVGTTITPYNAKFGLFFDYSLV